MSGVAVHGIVAGDESDIHDEPHVEGSRITVRCLHDRVEERGLRPETVADRHGLDLADVYASAAYTHHNPAEMNRDEERRERLVQRAAATTTLTPPDG
jgi:uncharacterized protein (DUF433 family)